MYLTSRIAQLTILTIFPRTSSQGQKQSMIHVLYRYTCRYMKYMHGQTYMHTHIPVVFLHVQIIIITMKVTTARMSTTVPAITEPKCTCRMENSSYVMKRYNDT